MVKDDKSNKDRLFDLLLGFVTWGVLILAVMALAYAIKYLGVNLARPVKFDEKE